MRHQTTPGVRVGVEPAGKYGVGKYAKGKYAVGKYAVGKDHTRFNKSWHASTEVPSGESRRNRVGRRRCPEPVNLTPHPCGHMHP